MNAEFVERKIEELLKFKKQIEQQAEQVAEEREKMKEAMKKLRGKIPKDMQRESDDEEDDGDEEEKQDKEPKAGEKQQQRLGRRTRRPRADAWRAPSSPERPTLQHSRSTSVSAAVWSKCASWPRKSSTPGASRLSWMLS